LGLVRCSQDQDNFCRLFEQKGQLKHCVLTLKQRIHLVLAGNRSVEHVLVWDTNGRLRCLRRHEATKEIVGERLDSVEMNTSSS